MLLRDYCTLFVKQPSETNRYGSSFLRYDLAGVMAFEKQSMDDKGRDQGSLVLYIFPDRSRVANSAEEIPVPTPGDYCAVGQWGDTLDPQNDPMGVCRRITAVTWRNSGTPFTHHMVIEAE